MSPAIPLSAIDLRSKIIAGVLDTRRVLGVRKGLIRYASQEAAAVVKRDT